MSSSFLKVMNPSAPCEDFPSEDHLACSFPFPLDPFQQHAVKAIHQGDNVLVTAKTGSGKTLVGEYLIHHCLKKGGRVFYTTPIKSLSNQKFHDLKQMFPSVGIMTGDIKYKPDAQVLIMTTEILRNLLYKQGSATANLGITAQISLEGLTGVVFDEVHYINDRERGKVWEETMILLDREIQLVLLSATIDRPELFAGWLGDLKQKPIHLISTSYRIVPLVHQVLCGSQPQTIMDNKEIFYDDAYRTWIQWREQKGKEKDAHKKLVDNRRAGGYSDPTVKGRGGMPSFTHQLNEAIKLLDQKSLMPALFFVFSRAGCEKYAGHVEGSLISSSDAAAIQHIWDFHLHVYREQLEHLPQAHQLLDLVKRGIAYHHSGLLPMLREMVEILFGKGLIKCLFATETFAVGINMPTKTVVFLDMMKFSDECKGLRLLRTDEYIQMAGRAGRRGKDTMGYVFYLPQRDPISNGEAKSMLTGKKSPITSRMEFGYDFLLKTLQANNLRWMDILEKSYWFQQREAEKQSVGDRIRSLEQKCSALGITEQQAIECSAREAAERKVKETTNATKKQAQRELDSLKNKQVGPVWTKTWKLYQDLKELELELEEERHLLETLKEDTMSVIEPRVSLLRKWGFMDADTFALTKLGTMATEINEGQPILLTKAYEAGLCSEMTQEEFVAFLAAFLAEGKEDENAVSLDDVRVPTSVKAALWKVDEWASHYQRDEDAKLGYAQVDPRFWALKTDWMEPAYRWVQGEDVVILCQDYGIYEGNFMRSLLKLANMLEEWINMVTYCQDVEMLKRLEGLREKLVRGIVKPESLYLKL